MSELEDEFEAAAERSKNLPEKPANHQLLDLYALYKQGSEGNVSGDRPGFTDFKARAKHDAWAEREGMSREKAMEKYIELVDRLEDELG